MSIFLRSFIALTIGAGSSLGASAQSTLPPPPKRPPLPEYVPPAERPAPRAPAAQNPRANQQPKFDPNTVEFEPIWHTADDGSVVDPKEHYEIAALKANPMVQDDQWDFIEVLLEDRQREMELVAQAHPRACVSALTTVIRDFDIADESTRIPLGDIALVLNQPDGIIGYLAEQGVISEEMNMMTHHIAMDYTRNKMANIATSQPEGTSNDDITSAQSRFLMRQGLAEPLMGFGRLARRAIEADPSLVENPEDLLAKQGDEFDEAAAWALAPLSDEELARVITEAYESEHGPVIK